MTAKRTNRQLRDAFFDAIRRRRPDAVKEMKFEFLRPRTALSERPDLLGRIARALEKHGRFTREEFIPTDRVLHCDIFIPSEKLVVEIDEAQHFTRPRALSLGAYPRSAPVGFSKREWIRRSLETDARDNDPPYRDEQRAFRDAMRDLLLPLHGFKPVRRIFIGELESDIETNGKWRRLLDGSL